MSLRVWVLTFIHVPDDGSSKPKHVVHWHNFRVNDAVCKKIYIYCGVSVSIMTAAKFMYFITPNVKERPHP
jgi:hypothetical protein